MMEAAARAEHRVAAAAVAAADRTASQDVHDGQEEEVRTHA